jgi:hypothetical protein
VKRVLNGCNNPGNGVDRLYKGRIFVVGAPRLQRKQRCDRRCSSGSSWDRPFLASDRGERRLRVVCYAGS